ncbi:DUF4367 domain-containing protein [Wansuia hejianensis]|uniref:DUF4367 domain-containing protein n=1 Tax=Wansuia hejianensis TaxID=2763667 RepID=A0A926IGW0_9FIRM|nr:DUF4367 domain-containing protein [Wansuia hejianensis]
MTSNAIINDTEGIEVERILIEEQEVISFTNKNVHQLYWNDITYIYIIISAYDKKDLIKMAESIIRNK